jgi:hypothetical protein
MAQLQYFRYVCNCGSARLSNHFSQFVNNAIKFLDQMFLTNSCGYGTMWILQNCLSPKRCSLITTFRKLFKISINFFLNVSPPIRVVLAQFQYFKIVYDSVGALSSDHYAKFVIIVIKFLYQGFRTNSCGYGTVWILQVCVQLWRCSVIRSFLKLFKIAIAFLYKRFSNKFYCSGTVSILRLLCDCGCPR